MHLVQDGEALLKASGQLKRLALNAEVYAVQSGQKGRVFQSLSKDTKKLSTDVTTVIRQLIDNVQSISAKAIESAGKTRLCEKYQEALDKNVRSPTRELVKLKKGAIEQFVIQALSNVYTSLRKSHKMMVDIERLHRQLPVIATLMKIEANRDDEFRNTFGVTAENLLVLNEELRVVIRDVHERTTDALRQIENMGAGANL